ncbi:MAG: hypothetical protein P8J78_05470 [Maricaulis sp.]|nr:hypothetical protein [Maricaulis sp.]MDG2044039.1 hypothetical protein [Maricaulis sp.]
MSLRLSMKIAAALVFVTGLSATGYSLTIGETGQAIAFGWPAFGIALLIGLATPSRKNRSRQDKLAA